MADCVSGVDYAVGEEVRPVIIYGVEEITLPLDRLGRNDDEFSLVDSSFRFPEEAIMGVCIRVDSSDLWLYLDGKQIPNGRILLQKLIETKKWQK
ncbi:MAG: hypothetical protein Q7S06_01130 [Nanoarchaeota archaeon]|nr:hypothetical protein [Nanoarchaeota archaeon]